MKPTLFAFAAHAAPFGFLRKFAYFEAVEIAHAPPHRVPPIINVALVVLFQHDYFLQSLENELKKTVWEDGNLIKLINVRCFYAALLLTGDAKDKLKSIKLLEDTLISYQQIPFQKFLDGIFVTLIMGYFSLKDYEKLISAHKRYKKITAEQLVVKENDLTIDTYYFTAQYLLNNRKQYIDKLLLAYNDKQANNNVKALINELVSYYSIPLNLI